MMEDSTLGIRRRNESYPSHSSSTPSAHTPLHVPPTSSLPSSGVTITPLKRRKVIRDLTSMEIEVQVGAGMYGCVYKAIDRIRGDKVALKYIKMAKESQGFPVTALREIKLLKAMNHENIIRLHDVITYAKPEEGWVSSSFSPSPLSRT
jgi:hypothetical protein